MAELNYQKQVQDNEREESFDALPAGLYPCVIEESDYKPNKKGTGMILVLKYGIIDGPFKGRKFFENLNLQNSNPQAAVIAQKAFNSLKEAVGLIEVHDSCELHARPLVVEMSCKVDKETNENKNSVKKHLPIGGPVSNTAPAAAPGTPPPPASTSAAPGGVKKKQQWEK